MYDTQFRPYSGVPVAGEKVLELKDSKGGNWDEWPPDLRIRQFPAAAAPCHAKSFDGSPDPNEKA